MKRFQSSATRLLSVARQQQRLCELILARAHAAASQAAGRLAEAEAGIAATEASLEGVLARGESILIMQALQGRVSQCATMREQRQTEWEQSVEEVARALESLRTQQQRTRSLERLEQRARDAYRREVLIEQEGWQDEQRLRRFGREGSQQPQVTHG